MAILGFAVFGAAVRFWQLGIEMRPFFQKSTVIGYPIFMAVGASVGYFFEGVEDRQRKLLTERRDALLEKRKRMRERGEGYTVPVEHDTNMNGMASSS